MLIKILRERVKVSGIDPFGRKTRIIFLPPADATVNGYRYTSWLWQRMVNDRVCVSTIESSLAKGRPRRIALMQNNSVLEVIEHITPLRWFGILGLTIDGSGWPPYFGRTWEFYAALHESLETLQHKVEWCTSSKQIKFSHQDTLGGYTTFKPSEKPGLHVRIVINYQGLGECELSRTFPEDLSQLKKDMGAYTPGIPHTLYYLSLLGNALRVWKHHNHISWVYALSGKKALQQFAQHRLVDFLGALALTHPTRLPAGTVESICGGHKSDLLLVRKIQEELVHIEERAPIHKNAIALSY